MVVDIQLHCTIINKARNIQHILYFIVVCHVGHIIFGNEIIHVFIQGNVLVRALIDFAAFNYDYVIVVNAIIDFYVIVTVIFGNGVQAPVFTVYEYYTRCGLLGLHVSVCHQLLEQWVSQLTEAIVITAIS